MSSHETSLEWRGMHENTAWFMFDGTDDEIKNFSATAIYAYNLTLKCRVWMGKHIKKWGKRQRPENVRILLADACVYIDAMVCGQDDDYWIILIWKTSGI